MVLTRKLGKNEVIDYMLKEEILEKSKKENRDEGQQYVENEGRKIGYVLFAITYAFLVVFNAFYGNSESIAAISALFWIFMSTDGYVKYRYTKNYVYLILFIAGGLASVLNIINHVVKTLG